MLPPIAADVVVADFDTELVVMVPSRRTTHLLEPSWAVVFDSCRRGHTVEHLVEELCDATGWSMPETVDWVQRALAELTDAGIATHPS